LFVGVEQAVREIKAYLKWSILCDRSAWLCH